MSALTRNAVVKMLGTPALTQGSLNDPREQEEGGRRFNEKWLYREPLGDPAGAAERVVYWHRYDFVASLVRDSQTEPWRPDRTLAAAAQAPEPGAQALDAMAVKHRADQPLPPLDLQRNPALRPRSPYRPVSEFTGPPDLGGHVEEPPVRSS